MKALANVIRAELFKVVRKRRAYILAGLYWLLLPGLVLIVGRIIRVNLFGSSLDGTIPVDSILHELASPFGIARVALAGPAFMSPSFYMIIIALLAALLVGEERSQNMWKTTLVAQPDRLAVISGKFLVAWLIFAVLVAGAVLSGFLFGAAGTTFLGTTFTGDWGQLFGALGLQVLFGGTAILFAFLLVFLLRSMALGLVAIFFLPALLEGLYFAYATLVGFQPVTRINAFFQALRLRQTLEDLPRYFFTSNLYAPSRKLVGSVLATLEPQVNGGGGGPPGLGGLLGSGETLLHSGFVMLGYGVLFGALLVWLFLRRDVA
jgi:ABC-type transport system involved in multi-copper enzyme maturation permease subunit